MTRRTAATLIEVLVTIFVMALGLIALLTLFPIGALKMAEAIKDSRSANAAGNADAIVAARGLRNDSVLNYARPQGTPAIAPTDGPSYPIYMDPIGFRSYSGLPSQLQGWVGAENPNGLGIRRVSPTFITQGNPGRTIEIQRTLASFSLLDDITFGPNGVPIGPDGNPSGGNNPVQREGRYTWALMFKRPKTGTPSVVDLTVVVYSGRPLQLDTGSRLNFGEAPFQATNGQEGGNSLVVRWDAASQEKPNLKKGSWVLDATGYDLSVQQLPADLRSLVLRHGPVHGFFYRVAKVVTEGTGWMELQLTTPLKADVYKNAPVPPMAAQPIPGYRPRIIVMENVAEVFERGPGWLP